ncbi:hypothetical protein FKW77_010485 [Venturia effusa]|uniref:CBM1 domain-containing protein n=1 Tax=Venturia effusa TaxID=50376 RepID=A0A517L0I3_9PEZI|nr:hypothetical protein FKW77_010485 [Venturia effusa]
MKATLGSAILLALSAVDAKKHRLCCCSGIDSEAPGEWSSKSPTCLANPNDEIVAASNGKLVTSTRVWNHNTDKQSPFNQDSSHWDYRNPGTFKRSQNIDQQGEIVDVAGLDIMERDILERRLAAATNPPAEPVKVDDLVERNRLMKRDHLIEREHFTKRDHVVKRDRLVRRDHVIKRAYNGKTSASRKWQVPKPSGQPYYGNGTGTTPVGTGTYGSGSLKVYPTAKPKPHATYPPVAQPPYGNGTTLASGGTGIPPTGTTPAMATGSASGVVYCNQYWKAPGCVDKPDPSAKPVVCGQYWKAKGCVPAATGK